MESKYKPGQEFVSHAIRYVITEVVFKDEIGGVIVLIIPPDYIARSCRTGRQLIITEELLDDLDACNLVCKNTNKEE